jgi:hypothetical protein
MWGGLYVWKKTIVKLQISARIWTQDLFKAELERKKDKERHFPQFSVSLATISGFSFHW